MPLTHVRTFRVRYYECDTYGRMNHTSYLRYMQEAALDASAAAGYDLARYEAIGRLWLVRETDIEYMHPVHYGDSVQVKTWVAYFGRVRSRRMYELRLAASQELVARAHIDWAFLDSATGRPAQIPPEMVAAFLPEGPTEPSPLRSRFPSFSTPPPGVFRLGRRVEWRDIDAAGHVNNAVYVAYLDDCEIRVVAAHGWSLDRMQAEGFAIVVRRHQIEYRQPAMLDDELELATWLSDMMNTNAIRQCSVKRQGDGTLLAQARTYLEWVDLETEQPIPVPASFLHDLTPNITGTIP